MIKNEKYIENWLNSMKIRGYTISDDLTVDVEGNVIILNKKLIEIPIQFGTVKGSFHCGYNQLISLKGCPKEVHDDFDCSVNNLASLKYGPEYVGRYFDCRKNQLSTLKGIAGKIGSVVFCCGNKLEDINGLDHFKKVILYQEDLDMMHPEISRLFEKETDSDSFILTNDLYKFYLLNKQLPYKHSAGNKVKL